MLADSAMSSFLGSVRAVDIAVPHDLSLVDSLARESSEAALSAAFQARLSANVGPQGGSTQDSGP